MLQLPGAGDHTWRLYSDAAPAVSPFPTRTPGSAVDNIEMAILPGRRLWTHRRLAAEVSCRPPGVLFVPAHVIPFVWPSRRLPPSVVTIHDLGYRHFPDAHTWRQRQYLHWSTHWSTQAATRVIAISQATADDLQTAYGVDRRKIDVIYEATVPAHRRRAHPRQDLRGRTHYMSARSSRVKNLVRLAQAYAKLVKSRDVAWDLVLAGGMGWLSDEVVRDINAVGLPGRIHFLGYVAEDGLSALLHSARLFCFVSLYEGFGLPVLEAQDAGVPVMTSNNSSLPEVAGDAAILVDPTDVDAIADAMLRLSSDEALRQRLIAAGHANVARFSWHNAARETLAVLLRAAQEKRS